MKINRFNKAYLFIAIVFSISLVLSNIMSFFGGVGFALLASIILSGLALITVLNDEDNKKRFTDILVLVGINIVLMFILFFAYDFTIDYSFSKFPYVMRNICSVFALISIVYLVFRYIYEYKGWNFAVIEFLLGNYVKKPRGTRVKKAKKSKEEIKKNRELENGTLEPKPSSVERESVDEYNDNTVGSLEETTFEQNVENSTENDQDYDQDIIRF